MNEFLMQNSPFMNELALSRFEPQSNVKVPYKSDFKPTEEQLQSVSPAAQTEIAITQLQAKYNQNMARIQELKTVIAGLTEKYAPKQQSEDELEKAMAANRARRIKKDDAALSQWRWKKEQDLRNKQLDLNYRWQKDMSTMEQNIADIQNRNDFNDRLNKALELWQKSKGDALAEAYAKQNVDGLLSLGKAKFGIDFSDKITEAQALDAENKSNEENATKAQKELENTQYKNFLKLNEQKPATFKTPAQSTAWLAKVRTAYENDEISMDQAEELRNIEESSQTKRKKKAESTGLEIETENQKAAADAGKLTLDEFKSKIDKGEALNKYESAALLKKKPEIMQKYETYKGLTGSRKQQFWRVWGKVFQKFNLEEIR